MNAIPPLLLDKLAAMTPALVAEVELFVDFLRHRTSGEVSAVSAAAASNVAFARVWDNADDAAYDAL